GVDRTRRADRAGVGRPGGAGARLRRPRPSRPLPAPARDDPRRDALRPHRQRARDRPLRLDRHAQGARVPERALLMRRAVRLALLAWLAYWVAGELASRAGGGTLPFWSSSRASKSTSAGTS